MNYFPIHIEVIHIQLNIRFDIRVLYYDIIIVDITQRKRIRKLFKKIIEINEFFLFIINILRKKINILFTNIINYIINEIIFFKIFIKKLIFVAKSLFFQNDNFLFNFFNINNIEKINKFFFFLINKLY